MTKRHLMKRLFLIVLAMGIFVPACVIGLELVREPGSDQVSTLAADSNGQIARGAYLARAGNCMACHTTRGGQEYAGGRAISTPFGNIYSSNITPDKKTGIGTWTSNDFWRAIHNGKSKDGSFLYPAFPYTSYTKVTRADSDAIFAYLRTLTPVAQENRQHELQFPFSQRILLAFWRMLYFSPGAYQEQGNQSPEWNRGAYLVQGLGHCSACHTSRNFLGGSADTAALTGGMIPTLNWYASSLALDAGAARRDWQTKDLADLLKTGVSSKGAVFGPMAEVISGSLQHLSASDINAMAIYLKSIPHVDTIAQSELGEVSKQEEAVLKQGAKLYEKYCAECHKSDGKGAPPGYPPLVGTRSLAARSPINPIRIVLNGGYPPTTKGNPRPYGMPPFAVELNDSEVAAVVSYIRTSWGNKGNMVSPIDVGRFRGAPIE
ncbi:alcohol dehydrogenase [Noviherbaspirillum autotrophicum]|uniref:Alcohol dehydrogenase n=2 Tax=Noviherbaspirillum autotrophicum TaxID=709839 RepID=A0A0C2BK66_9BURK|nr:cytochrome c [Noviherbaspirillum autotrophicum]KIF81645.1 alcohol dehydrogenase [Noviherbaspirillum autotrophicum]KIF82006.1 alcohol dehydrogenase [Noviherbaspirillum autotrophicum]KIF84108.1 alcohol dehydrogenase [Noviherbaspirillum autotrophicum]